MNPIQTRWFACLLGQWAGSLGRILGGTVGGWLMHRRVEAGKPMADARHRVQ